MLFASNYDNPRVFQEAPRTQDTVQLLDSLFSYSLEGE